MFASVRNSSPPGSTGVSADPNFPHGRVLRSGSLPRLIFTFFCAFVLGLQAAGTAANPAGPFDITAAGAGSWSYITNTLTITADGSYTITMLAPGASTSTDHIVVQAGVTADVTLDGVNIDVSAIDDTAAFDLTGATVSPLILIGANTLKSGLNRAGLQAPAGSALAIVGPGSLEADGGSYGAGIGGGELQAGGNIAISGGGTVNASSSAWGAGIGGGYKGDGGSIIIAGDANVTAAGGKSFTADLGGGAGIGSGGTDAVTPVAAGTISIDASAAVTANGGTGNGAGGNGAPIGEGGYNGDSGAGINSFTSPVDTTVPAGSSAVFTCSVTMAAGGGPVANWGWDRSTDNGMTALAVPGAIAATLTISNVTPAMSGYLYSCIVDALGGDMITGGRITYRSPLVKLTVRGDTIATAVPTLSPVMLVLSGLLTLLFGGIVIGTTERGRRQH